MDPQEEKEKGKGKEMENRGETFREKIINMYKKNVIKSLLSVYKGDVVLIGSMVLALMRDVYIPEQNNSGTWMNGKNIVDTDIDIVMTEGTYFSFIKHLSKIGKAIKNEEKDMETYRFFSSKVMERRGIENIIPYYVKITEDTEDIGSMMLLELLDIEEFTLNFDIILMKDSVVENGRKLKNVLNLIEKYSPNWPIFYSARNLMCYETKEGDFIFELFKTENLFLKAPKKQMTIYHFFEVIKNLNWYSRRIEKGDNFKLQKYNKKKYKRNNDVSQIAVQLLIQEITIDYHQETPIELMDKYFKTKKYGDIDDPNKDSDCCNICHENLNEYGDNTLNSWFSCGHIYHTKCLTKLMISYISEYISQIEKNDLLDSKKEPWEDKEPRVLQIGDINGDRITIGHLCCKCRFQGLSKRFGRKIITPKGHDWVFPPI